MPWLKAGRRLENGAEIDSALHDAAETIGRALKLPYVLLTAGELNQSYGRIPAEASGSARFPLLYQGESLGELCVTARDGESIDERDRVLLEALSRQAGAALHTAKATADVRRSRERIVTAREEERRRIRRDLHDGLGPRLASLYQRIDAARGGIDTDPQSSVRMLEDAAAQMKFVIADIRTLVYLLRPLALDALSCWRAERRGAQTVRRARAAHQHPRGRAAAASGRD